MNAPLEVDAIGPTLLALEAIKVDQELQCRTGGTVKRVVAEYAVVIDQLPPITVFVDKKGTHWLADGFHRYAAHQLAQRTEIAVDLRQGSRRDALLYAAGANASHGLRRTTADKQRAVALVLGNFPNLSDRKIAEICAVDHKTVGAARARLKPAEAPEDGEIPQAEEPAPDPLARLLTRFELLLRAVPEAQRTHFADRVLEMLGSSSEVVP